MYRLSVQNKVKQSFVLFLIGLTLFSPSAVLAGNPVSAPVTIPITMPVPVPVTNAPEMVYPVNGQTLDLEGDYIFKVKPIKGATGYLFGLFQNGQMIYENLRDTKRLSPNGEFYLSQYNPAHQRFQAGQVKVMVRASVNNNWTDAREITITLKPRNVKPQIYSIWPYKLQVGRYFLISGKDFGGGGKINFYTPGTATASGSATIRFWSNYMITGVVPSNLKPNQQYAIQVRSNQDSPLVYRYISK